MGQKKTAVVKFTQPPIEKKGGNPRHLSLKLTLGLTSSSKSTLLILSTRSFAPIPESLPKNLYGTVTRVWITSVKVESSRWTANSAIEV
ncbi:hypothetical protein H6F96_28245 [Microcoleus sp. FACHB-53]|jgi:hypothetical protein|nr:hypothetical protein [Microcoleus sp. FACHB-53]MBD2130665.1 hypothetical protein [Microcoleus sp. FACHB-1]